MRRVFPWLYSFLLFAMGAAFLIAAYAQGAAADTYRNARECPDAASPNCFQLSSGTIRSVSVAQPRGGEQDTTVIDTRGTTLTVILEPPASAASHVRTGAQVVVKWYQGKVTLVTVDSLGISSIDNPLAQQSDFEFYGLFLVGFGALSVVLPVWVRRRRARRAEALSMQGPTPAAGLEQSLLPTGTSGWIVKATLKRQAVVALGLGVGFLLLFTLPRVLGDPTRTPIVIALDAAIAGAGIVSLVLYLRNSKVIGDRQEVTRVTWLGRSQTFPLSDILHVDRFRSGQGLYAIFAGRDGRQLFRVSGIYWDFDQLDQMCRELGLELIGDYMDIVGSRGIRKRANASTNWGSTILVLAALGALIVVFVIVQTGPSSR
jgi:hypothetical protein